MTKKDLQEYIHIKEELKGLDLEREYWYAAAEKCTRDNREIRICGGRRDKLPEIVDKLSELGSIATSAYDRLVTLRRHIEDMVAMLDGMERLIIRGRYIEGKRWEDLAGELGYSTESLPYLHKVHGRALRKLAMESNPANVI